MFWTLYLRGSIPRHTILGLIAHPNMKEECKQILNQILKKNNKTWIAWSAIDDAFSRIDWLKI